MLKLEKSHKNSEIHIRVRQPIRCCDRYFIISLLSALSLHLFAALLFHVRLFSSGEIETILPATRAYTHHVKSSTQQNDSVSITQANLEGRLTPAQLIPPTTEPSLDTFFISSIYNIQDLKPSSKDHAFIDIEKDIEENYFMDFDLPLSVPFIKIEVAGPLAEIPFQNMNPDLYSFFDNRTFSSQKLQQKHCLFAVQVDPSSGQIFWFQLNENDLDKDSMILAEKILKNILFKTSGDDIVLSGFIEMTFSSGNV